MRLLTDDELIQVSGAALVYTVHYNQHTYQIPVAATAHSDLQSLSNSLWNIAELGAIGGHDVSLEESGEIAAFKFTPGDGGTATGALIASLEGVTGSAQPAAEAVINAFNTLTHDAEDTGSWLIGDWQSTVTADISTLQRALDNFGNVAVSSSSSSTTTTTTTTSTTTTSTSSGTSSTSGDS